MTTLSTAEHDNASMKDATNKALTEANALGAKVDVLMAGQNAKTATEAAAARSDPKEALLAKGDCAHDLAEPSPALIVSLTSGYDLATVPAGGSAESVAAAPDADLPTFVGKKVAKSDRPELTSAEIIVSAGRAMPSQENSARYIEPLADKLGVVALRAAFDAGYAPNDWQVGQTGEMAASERCVAVGASGAIQYLARMKDFKVVVAINKETPDLPGRRLLPRGGPL
jgi:electron transfer flavoprotein alpha subunit